MALPEWYIANGRYKDTGCSEAPSCLSCPLEMCVLDRPQNWESEERREKIRKLWGAGDTTVKAIAGDLGISTRTVHRALE